MDEAKNGQKIVSTGKTTCACGPGCSCGCGPHCMHSVIWWVLGIVILIIVFCVGVKAGEFREELRGMFGGYYRGYPMMQYREYGSGGYTPPVTAAPGNDGGTGIATGTAPVGL